ncbi:4-hydroxy-3-methylbut-2-enyl diphosphate reductase [Methylophilales bacterium HTCC2181]|uniref:4-hydroxy-3-methylbut-2-enyl diphosphate reductase n=1 Tax=Methylophilales bacterium HTCC2181 TaxID=383631 RepID=A0P575_9PROT|nr:4-hydroxy-3-methylbut-2-enyl diphosphate reductase [Methylophilales bacterium HTCC2181]
MNNPVINIALANPRGFCAGVERAIIIVEQALKKFGAPIYVRHEVVHNRFVIDDLKSKGAIFVDNIADIPEGSHVIFSAHGVSKVVKTDAKNRKLIAIDATCPLVTKVHREVNKMYGENYHIIMIGHTGHPEVEGTMGQIEKNSPDASIHLIENKEDVSNLTIPVNNRVSYVSQTTLSVDDTQEIIEALKYKYPNIQGPKSSDICYATQNRQDSVKKMIAYQDIILVVGSANSSNSNRLVEIAKKQGIEAHLIDNPDEFDSDILKGKNRIGLTAGASAPEAQVQLVINFISQFNKIELTEIDGIEESITFKLPIF